MGPEGQEQRWGGDRQPVLLIWFGVFATQSLIALAGRRRTSRSISRLLRSLHGPAQSHGAQAARNNYSKTTRPLQSSPVPEVVRT